jgi:hypothetical protein
VCLNQLHLSPWYNNHTGDGALDLKEFVKMAVEVRKKTRSTSIVQLHDLSFEQLEVCRKAFDKCDADASGSIDQQELGDMLQSLGVSFSRSDLEPVIAQYDRDDNGVLDFDEFVSLFARTRALTSGDIENAEKLQQQWLKKCSQDLLQKKRARQAALAAAKKAFSKGNAMAEIIETARDAAEATQAPENAIELAADLIKKRVMKWLAGKHFQTMSYCKQY